VRDAAIPAFPSATPGASERSTGAAAAPAAGEDAAPAFSSATPGASERPTGAAAAPAAGEDAAPAFPSATPGASAATGRAVATPAAGSGESEPAALRTLRERFRAWRFAPVVEIVATVALALVLAESVQAAVVKPFVIPSQSMEPTLLPGQRVLVNRLAYDFGGTPARGDIVVFHPPSSLTCKANVPLTEPCPQGVGTHASDYFVKRVIGLPGDTLSIKDGHPVINGRELANEPYITPCSDSTSCNMPHAIVIPRGEYYMLGDNRGDSDDSRYWGPVRLSWIIGEVFATYWPIDRIGVF
jgi:signal peptidase I